MIIAIDGPAASGKGTLARRIAAHYGLRYLDTGSLYRAVARDVMATDGDLRDVATATAAARALDPVSLDDPVLRERGVGEAASIVARIPQVRTAILDYQRNFGSKPPGAVIDGRDIGTIVCPNADVKLFVVAALNVRADRRYKELREKGFDVTLEQVTEEIRNRDRRDLERDVAPLAQAEDARLLDTSDLSIGAATCAAVDLIDAMRAR
ncbi:MAG: (d)CMP kinase [Pseudomonadota bacterium]